MPRRHTNSIRRCVCLIIQELSRAGGRLFQLCFDDPSKAQPIKYVEKLHTCDTFKYFIYCDTLGSVVGHFEFILKDIMKSCILNGSYNDTSDRKWLFSVVKYSTSTHQEDAIISPLKYVRKTLNCHQLLYQLFFVL